MEKNTPHYGLAQIQAVVAARRIACFTATARDGGLEMGLAYADMLAAIAALTRRDFHKSMTTYNDHRIWQDVYTAKTEQGDAYVKFTLRTDGAVVISFKRKFQ
jgi:motility quorum-sensing regulator/GCU-specific mRNA interferase toxin